VDSSSQRADCLSTQTSDGQRLILSNETLHERGVILGTYSNVPGEFIKTRDQYVVFQNDGQPARAERHSGGRSIAFVKRPRSLTFIPPGFGPGVRLHTASKLFFCQINAKVINELAGEMDREPESLPVFKSGITDKTIAGILALMRAELQSGAQLGTLYIETLAHALAIKLLHIGPDSGPIASSGTSPLPPHKLKRVKELIESGLEKDLSLKVLASESGYSRAHFLRMFSISTGTTPHRYVLERRIDRAQRLLKEKRASLANIAAACGFSSQTHMADVFRSNLNTTPREYRRKL
jgi:AraC family transcriptional regulator